MKTILTFLVVFLLTTATSSLATRLDPSGLTESQFKSSKQKGQNHNDHQGASCDGGNDNGMGGFVGPGGGYNIPGFGSGWGKGVGGGYGAGYGSPNGGYTKDVTVGYGSSVVCKDNGPCYNQKLTCPATCSAGGASGGCIIDCKYCSIAC